MQSDNQRGVRRSFQPVGQSSIVDIDIFHHGIALDYTAFGEIRGDLENVDQTVLSIDLLHTAL